MAFAAQSTYPSKPAFSASHTTKWPLPLSPQSNRTSIRGHDAHTAGSSFPPQFFSRHRGPSPRQLVPRKKACVSHLANPMVHGLQHRYIYISPISPPEERRRWTICHGQPINKADDVLTKKCHRSPNSRRHLSRVPSLSTHLQLSPMESWTQFPRTGIRAPFPSPRIFHRHLHHSASHNRCVCRRVFQRAQ